MDAPGAQPVCTFFQRTGEACSRRADRECGAFPAPGRDSGRPSRRWRAPRGSRSVISWKWMRRTGTFASHFNRCQLIDSPSRSGSVASTTSDASFRATSTPGRASSCPTDDVVGKSPSVSTPRRPIFLADLFRHLIRGVGGSERGRSCFNAYRSPRKRDSVLAFAGDSTITRVWPYRFHPNTFCQTGRTVRRRLGGSGPAVPARTTAAATAPG